MCTNTIDVWNGGEAISYMMGETNKSNKKTPKKTTMGATTARD
jgi:hypothetical protein